MTRILVADDNHTTRLLLTEILRAGKFTVVAVADGAAALKKLKEEKFDLALLDVWMPKKNGLEVLAALRKSNKKPKVIVMTSDDTPETLLSAIREEAYQYVTKPIEPKSLISLIRETLARTSKTLPIEVISARPTWVELAVPCTLEAAERIEGFMAHLKVGLSEDVQRSVGQAFHELLLNGIEWGGKLDPSRKVRISYLRGKRMLLYRIAVRGRDLNSLSLSMQRSAIVPMNRRSTMKCAKQKGLRPGGYGGLLLAKANVDDLLYNEAQNEVVFVKYLDEESTANAEPQA